MLRLRFRLVTAPARLLAMTCALTIAAPPIAHGQASPSPDEPADDPLRQAESLYNRGRASFETADYFKAIELWTEAYGLVSDAPENAAIKAALIYNIASAQEKAYDIDTDPAHLRQAAVLMERYAGSVPALYGQGAEAETEAARVAARLAQLRARIEEAEAQPPPPDPGPAPPPEPLDPGSSPVTDPGPPDPGQDPLARPLIISGAVALGLGVAGLGTMAAGLAMGDGANDISDLEPDDTDQRRDRFDRGRTGNTVALVGGIVGGVLLTSGAVLLGLGLKKRSARRVAITPVGGPRSAGLRVRTRF